MRIIALLICLIPTIAMASWDSAIAELRQEVKIKDLQFEVDHSVLRVGVLDDGSPRDGYASYVCAILMDHGVTSRVLIRVIDIARLVREKEWVTLGSSRCN